MAVNVSLFELVRLEHSDHLWPDAFLAQIGAVEAEPEHPHDRLAVLADWLREMEEPELERACRYVAKRPDVAIQMPTDKKYGRWTIHGVPYQIERITTKDSHGRGVAAALAELALKIEAARKELE